MTVSTGTDSNTYIATGSVATYTYTFRILQASDLLVQVIDATGAAGTKVLTTDYTVTGVGSYTGGTITFTAGNVTAGYTVFIFRNPAVLQTTSLQTQGAYSATSVETALDLLTMIDQAQGTVIARALQVSAQDTASTLLPAASLRANKTLAFDSSGNATVLSGVVVASNVPVESIVQVIDTIALLKALAKPAAAVTYLVRGYYAIADGGGGVFEWNSASAAADDAGMVIAANAGGTGRWIRIAVPNYFDVKWFGAKGDGVATDTTAIQAALNAANVTGGGTVFVPVGTYLHGALTLYASTALRGASRATTKLQFTGATGHGITASVGMFEISNMRLHASSAGNGAFAIYSTGAVSDDVVLTQLWISGYFAGIFFQQSENTLISNCLLQGQGKNIASTIGIQIGDGGGTSTTTTIQSCYIQNYETSVWNQNCPSMALIHPVFENAKTALLVNQKTTVLHGYWELIDTWQIYANGDGVLVFGGYGVDFSLIFRDATYGMTRSIIIDSGSEPIVSGRGITLAQQFFPGAYANRTDTSGAGTTWAASNMVQYIMTRSGPGAPYTDTTATAAAIISLIPQAMVNTCFELIVRNTVNFTMTLNAGAGVTLTGTTVTSGLTWRRFVGFLTNVTAGAEALTLMGVGSGTL